MKLFQELEQSIQDAYDIGASLEEAEKLASKFLYAQIKVSEQLQQADLNSRMRKSGLKAVKAAVYNDSVSKSDKKPTESQLEHTINSNELVNGEQDELDKAEVNRDALARYYSIFQNAHIHFRSIAKGPFNG